MISPNTREVAQKLSQTRKALELAILQDMDATARRIRLTHMTATRWACTSYCRKSQRIKSNALDTLLDLFCGYVDPGGFSAHWTSEKGWT